VESLQAYAGSTNQTVAGACAPRIPALDAACRPDALPKIRLRDAPSGAGRTKRRLGVSPASLFGLALAISLWALADLAASLHSAPPAETHTGAHVSFVGLVSSAPPHHGGRPLCCPVWSSPWRGPRSTVEVAQRITTSINPRGSQAFAGDRQASRSDTHTRLRGTAHG
jgi:hypothetical protein